MLKQTSKNFKEFFLLEFVKEIIRSTDKYKEILIKKEVHEVLKHQEFLKKIEEERKKNEREKVENIVKKKLKKERQKISRMKKEGNLPSLKSLRSRKPSPRKFHVQSSQKNPTKFPFKNFRQRKTHFRIHELQLPETVSDIRPTPGKETINLGKLDSLVRDPLVREIECNGPDQKIMVKGAMGRKSTGTILTEDEVNEVIEKFSKAAKIPTSTGVFKVVHGRLVLSAIISEVVGSKFIIKKMSSPPINIPLPSKR